MKIYVQREWFFLRKIIIYSSIILYNKSFNFMHFRWEFRSHNIPECLAKLIERRVLVTPVPYYISNLMVLGKNEITLQYKN